MKKHIFDSGLFVILGTIIVAIILLFGIVSDAKNIKQKSETAQPLVIETPTPTQEGRVTVYDKDGEIIYDYQGDFINVVNDGTNGEQIQIEINIPYESDSCFQ